MHLVLRSGKAVGPQSFRTPKNVQAIKRIVEKFAAKFAVKVHSLGNAKNHLHFHIQLRSRHTYRPFSRVVVGRKAWLTVRDYVEINELEGSGLSRAPARWIIGKERVRPG